MEANTNNTNTHESYHNESINTIASKRFNQLQLDVEESFTVQPFDSVVLDGLCYAYAFSILNTSYRSSGNPHIRKLINCLKADLVHNGYFKLLSEISTLEFNSNGDIVSGEFEDDSIKDVEKLSGQYVISDSQDIVSIVKECIVEYVNNFDSYGWLDGQETIPLFHKEYTYRTLAKKTYNANRNVIAKYKDVTTTPHRAIKSAIWTYIRSQASIHSNPENKNCYLQDVVVDNNGIEYDIFKRATRCSDVGDVIINDVYGMQGVYTACNDRLVFDSRIEAALNLSDRERQLFRHRVDGVAVTGYYDERGEFVKAKKKDGVKCAFFYQSFKSDDIAWFMGISSKTLPIMGKRIIDKFRIAEDKIDEIIESDRVESEECVFNDEKELSERLERLKLIEYNRDLHNRNLELKKPTQRSGLLTWELKKDDKDGVKNKAVKFI